MYSEVTEKEDAVRLQVHLVKNGVNDRIMILE